jgi:prophage DNA circulation protein
MDWRAEIIDTAGALADATWNGIPFFMPDSRHSTGRRVHRYFFPGQDATVFQDLGALDGPMRVSGLLIGDAYVLYAQQLEAAFRLPGSGMLVHPWLGEIEMVLLEPVQFRFSQKTLRVCTFEAVFAPYYPATPPALSSLDSLILGVNATQAAAQQWLVQQLAPIASGALLLSGVQGYVASLQSYWTLATGPTGAAPNAGNAIGAAAAAPVAALSNAPLLTPGAGFGGGLGALLAAVPASVASASATQASPVVSGAAGYVAPVPLDGRLTLAVLLAATAQATGQTVTQGAVPAVALAQAALCVASAVQASTTIAWVSAEEAQAALESLRAAIRAVAQLAIALVADGPLTGGLLWRSLESLGAALTADMSALIGRLPAVKTVVTARAMSVWLIANALVGDTPSAMLPTIQDIVARNGIANPALVPAGPLAVLESA